MTPTPDPLLCTFCRHEIRCSAQPVPALDVEGGYTVLISSVPALYRSWRGSPNERAARLNRILLDAAIEWLQSYERATGRPVDEFREYSPSGDPA